MEMSIDIRYLKELTIYSPLERVANDQEYGKPLHTVTFTMLDHLHQRLLLTHPADLGHIGDVFLELGLHLSLNQRSVPATLSFARAHAIFK